MDAPLLRQIIEGLLLAAGRPLSVPAIAELFLEGERPEAERIKAALEDIASDCEARGFELKEVASGFRFQVRQHLSPWISRLSEERPQRYTRALLETLGLIAYRQPITRGDIEEIRGVAVSSTIIRTLLDREWIRVVGHRDVPGRPAMFATTRQFLDYFNLKSLQQLPPLAEIRDLDQLMPELDLGDSSEGRVLVLPDENEISVDAEDSVIDEQELLDEDEAMALARRPLDEILGYNREKNATEAAAKNIEDGQTTQGKDPTQEIKDDR
ncbi:MAG: SMC-Scp complex subunit ScpB [Pseudohongiella sp.]|nr:SMC-Scp complex subunit ScpB [Pseudohongiella sp.]MDO9519572.1 SMC-Scp complex subunit ScpB [Pseudohongiella sp.]MDP2127420.1 SMC-Scp complex subunit ScpB [Pseudohongiella sp.]